MTDAQAQSQEEQSMEEILESIRRIIAEDEDGNPIEAEAVETADPSEQEDGSEITSEENVNDDVLELTEIIDDTPEAEEIEQSEEMEEEPVMENTAAQDDTDILNNIDTALTVEETEEEAPKASEPDEALISGEIAKAASDKLKELKSNITKPAPVATPSPVTRNGTTVEDLMVEAMRPMLKEWLDTNLPSIVERIVEREVRKITD